MENYQKRLKEASRNLRSNMTDAEQRLWQSLRRKQIHGVQFYRQKPILNFIVDFYSPQVKLVVELDGGQHFEPRHQFRDRQRDQTLQELGLIVMRFDNRQVLTETEAVLALIEQAVAERLEE